MPVEMDEKQQKPQVFVIAGPTASGKTKLGVEVAKRHNGEVVSVDSMQIYRGMDIGTAKVTPEEMEGVPHHMLDILDPSDSFSVAQYVEMASSHIDDILQRGKLPILVGGTGQYLDALTQRQGFSPIPENKELRKKLEEEILQTPDGGAILLERLRSLDFETAGKLFPNDHKRIVRGLEVVLTTGKTRSQFDRESRCYPPRYRAIGLGLNYENRDDLREKIALRVDLMMEQGLLQEVESLLHLPKDCTAMQAIGYKELRGAVTGEMDLKEAVELLKIRSRQYAKRQMTWFRNKSNLRWYLWEKFPNIQNALQFSTDYLQEFEVI